MKILEIVSGLGLNGAIVHARALSRELAVRGHDVTVLCRPGSWMASALRGEAVDVWESHLHTWPLGELRRIAALIRAADIDIVHTHMTDAHFFGTVLKWFCDVPVVATAHSRRMQLHWAFNDRVIAVSDVVRQFQRRYNRVATDRLRVVHPFVDVDRFAPVSAEDRAISRAELGLGASDLVVGVVGSVFKEKRILDVVRAFSGVRRHLPRARLVIVGAGPADYVTRVKHACESLGITRDVVWAGARNDVAALVGTFDALAVASEDESFCMALVEAMATGVPVVATNIGGIPEAVADGTTGLLVPLGDITRLEEVLTRVLADESLRRRLGEAGRARAVERFSLAQVGRIEEIFEELLRERHLQRAQASSR